MPRGVVQKALLVNPITESQHVETVRELLLPDAGTTTSAGRELDQRKFILLGSPRNPMSPEKLKECREKLLLPAFFFGTLAAFYSEEHLMPDKSPAITYPSHRIYHEELRLNDGLLGLQGLNAAIIYPLAKGWITIVYTGKSSTPDAVKSEMRSWGPDSLSAWLNRSLTAMDDRDVYNWYHNAYPLLEEIWHLSPSK